MRALPGSKWLWIASLSLLGCGGGSNNEPAAPLDGAIETDTSELPCTAESCTEAGSVCRAGACVRDCRFRDANRCPTGTACDFADGTCRDEKSECFLAGNFEPCPAPGLPMKQCGPGTLCDGNGSCVQAVGSGCSGEASEPDGRTWATECSCERPAPRCSTASLEELNKAEFVGSLLNDRDSEGAFDLDFDDVCTAYAVTMISGPDYLRQMTPDGVIKTWTSTTNLNMGQVAVLRVPNGEFKELGDVAATYICCATCGCAETGEDGRLGVVRLDRKSAARPLPNVIAAKPTSGTGPFGSPSVDTGPYALTWGADRALYAGNIETNGDFVRLDLETKAITNVTGFLTRITSAAIYDLQRLIVATEGGQVYLVKTANGERTEFAKLPAHVTSMKRDKFTGRVYAEVATMPPQILEISADGKQQTLFQSPPRLGRVTIAPDNHLYHLSVYPAVQWKAKTSIVRWPLPPKR